MVVGLLASQAEAAAATVVSAKITSPTQFTVVYSIAVDAVYTNYDTLVIDGHVATSVDSMTGTGTATHVITFTPSVALTKASIGTVNIAALVAGGSGNTFAGQTGQALTDGQAPSDPTAGNYRIAQNAPGTADLIMTNPGSSAGVVGDTINVYDSATGNTLLGSAYLVVRQ